MKAGRLNVEVNGGFVLAYRNVWNQTLGIGLALPRFIYAQNVLGLRQGTVESRHVVL